VRKFFAIVFFGCICFSPFVYSDGISDSLEQAVEQADSEYERLKLSMELLDSYYRQGFSQKALDLGNTILEDAIELNKPLAIARIHNRLATILTNIGGRENEALTHLYKAQVIYEDQNDEYGLGIVYNNLGNIYRDLAYDTKAMEFYTKSLETCRKIDDSEGIAYALKNIAILYEHQNWYDEALDYHQQALEIRTKQGDKFQIVSSLLNVAVSYNGLNSYSEALKYLDKAEELAKSVNSELIDEIYLEKGNVYKNMGRYQKSISNYQMAINRSKAAQKYKILSSALSQMIDLHLISGNLDNAASHLQIFDSLKEELDYVRASIDFYSLSYRYDSMQNDELSALRNHKSMSDLKDSLNEISSSEDIIQQRSALEALEYENQLKLERTQKAYQNRIYTYIVIFLFLIIGVLFYTFNLKVKSNRKLNDLNKQLNETVEALKNANSIIGEQNEEISAYNEDLERKVRVRTQEIVKYGKTMEKYAFMTSHELRAPLARLLGLGHLLEINQNDEKKNEIVEKIVLAAKELDRIIHEINLTLEKNKGD